MSRAGGRTLRRGLLVAIADGGTSEGAGIRLTTEGTGGPGRYLRTPLGAVELSGGQAPTL